MRQRPTLQLEGTPAVSDVVPQFEDGGRRAPDVVFSPGAEYTAAQETSTNLLYDQTHSILTPGRYANFYEVTHPDLDAEVFGGVENETIARSHSSGISSEAPIAQSISGRVLRLEIETGRGFAGSAHTHDEILFLDEAYMPAYLDMEAEIAKSEMAGSYSPYWQLLHTYREDGHGNKHQVRSDRDIYYVLREEPETGDWRVAGILSGNQSLAGDSMIQISRPNDNGTITYEPAHFLSSESKAGLPNPDYLAELTKNPDVAKQYKGLVHHFETAHKQGSQHLLTSLVMAVTSSLLNPEYDFSKDKHLNSWARKEAGRIIDGLLERGTGAHPWLRAGFLLQELQDYETMHKLSGRGSREIAEQRARILQSLLGAIVYDEIVLGSVHKIDEVAHNKRNQLAGQFKDYNTDAGSCLRVEARSVDEIDRFLSWKAAEVIRKAEARGDGSRQELFEDLSKRIPETDDKSTLLYILGTGKNRVAKYQNLAARTEPDAPSGGFKYGGVGIPNTSLGHYPFEIADSLKRPLTKDPRFPGAGLAMSGIVAVFDIVTPEYSAGETHAPEPVRCMILSDRNIPRCVSRALHDIMNQSTRKDNVIKNLQEGFDLTNELEKTREQHWRLARFNEKGFSVDPRVLANGSAYALATDGRAIYEDFGKIPHERPRQRAPQSFRPRHGNRDLHAPRYDKGTPSRLTGETGSHRALFEVLLADGAFYASKTPNAIQGLAINAFATPHFVDVIRKAKRGLFRRK